MILLSCEKITKSFGANIILDQISFSVKSGSRIGIVGANGSGKTTLFNLIIGKIPYDEGSIYKVKNLSIGYLEQNQAVDSSNTVWGELLLFIHLFGHGKTHSLFGKANIPVFQYQ